MEETDEVNNPLLPPDVPGSMKNGINKYFIERKLYYFYEIIRKTVKCSIFF